MPSTNVCAYKGCGNVKRRDSNLTFHRFPKEEARLLTWIERCNNQKLEGMTPVQLENLRICSLHFSPDDFQSYGRQGKRKIKFDRNPHLSDMTVIAQSSSNMSRIDLSIVEQCKTASSSADVLLPIGVSSDRPEQGCFPDTVRGNCSSKHALSVGDDDEVNSVDRIGEIDLPSNPTAGAINLLPQTADDTIVRSPINKVKNPPISTGSDSVTSQEAYTKRYITILRFENKMLKQKVRRLKAAAVSNSHHVKFAKAVASLTRSQQDFIQMQIDHSKKRFWSQAEKQFALALFYTSPKAYLYLRDKIHFALPCVTLIRGWINELNLTPGVSAGVFDKLQIKAHSMTVEERQCVLMWDEMSLKRLLEYDPKSDLIEGFQDLGELGRCSKLANYALTFMIRGLTYSWKQPISYVTSSSCVCNENLKKLILAIVDKVHSIGFDIKAMVCDQGPSNQTALTSLGVTIEKPYIERECRKIYVMFDPPHLIKCVRNNLIRNDFVIEDDTISWKAISDLRDIERDKACKAAPKLTDRHINPNSFQRMTVSLATQVFSASVSAAISAGHFTGELQHPSSIATANFCKRLNDTFDCLNSRRSTDPNPLKRALSSAQPQVEEYLRQSIKWIKKWTVKGRPTPPCFSGLTLTITSVLQLWADMQKSGLLYLITSRLNQDPIENLFAILRGRGGYNLRPSAMTFRRSLQYAMTANLMKPSSLTNCEPDETMALLPILESRNGNPSPIKTDFRQEIDVWVDEQPINKDRKSATIDEVEEDRQDSAAADESALAEVFGGSVTDRPIIECSGNNGNEDEAIDESFDVVSDASITSCTLEQCAMKYVAGYLAYKCFKKYDCSECRSSLTKQNQNYENVDELLIFWRAYKCKENFELGNLKVPSDEFNNVTSTMYTVFTETFSSEPHRVNLKKHLETSIHDAVSNRHFKYWSVEGDCVEHRQYLVQLFVRVHIFNKVKWISRDVRDKWSTGNAGQKKRPCNKYSGMKANQKLQKVAHE